MDTTKREIIKRTNKVIPRKEVHKIPLMREATNYEHRKHVKEIFKEELLQDDENRFTKQDVLE